MCYLWWVSYKMDSFVLIACIPIESWFLPSFIDWEHNEIMHNYDHLCVDPTDSLNDILTEDKLS